MAEARYSAEIVPANGMCPEYGKQSDMLMWMWVMGWRDQWAAAGAWGSEVATTRDGQSEGRSRVLDRQVGRYVGMGVEVYLCPGTVGVSGGVRQACALSAGLEETP